MSKPLFGNRTIRCYGIALQYLLDKSSRGLSKGEFLIRMYKGKYDKVGEKRHGDMRAHGDAIEDMELLYDESTRNASALIYDCAENITICRNWLLGKGWRILTHHLNRALLRKVFLWSDSTVTEGIEISMHATGIGGTTIKGIAVVIDREARKPAGYCMFTAGLTSQGLPWVSMGSLDLWGGLVLPAIKAKLSESMIRKASTNPVANTIWLGSRGIYDPHVREPHLKEVHGKLLLFHASIVNQNKWKDGPPQQIIAHKNTMDRRADLIAAAHDIQILGKGGFKKMMEQGGVEVIA